MLELSAKRIPLSAQPVGAVPITMKSIRQAIGDIISIMPDVQDGASVALMYDALTPFMSPAVPQPKPKPTTTIHNVSREALAANDPRYKVQLQA